MLARNQVLAGVAGVAAACAGVLHARIGKRETAVAFADNSDGPACVSGIAVAVEPKQPAGPSEASMSNIANSMSSAVSAINTANSSIIEESAIIQASQEKIQNVDVIVIGGGIVGCTVGYFLAKNNKSVAIFDRGPFDCHWPLQKHFALLYTLIID